MGCSRQDVDEGLEGAAWRGLLSGIPASCHRAPGGGWPKEDKGVIRAEGGVCKEPEHLGKSVSDPAPRSGHSGEEGK